MPNVQGISTNPWEDYITTVDAVESLTGYDFFSNLPDAVENCVEAGTDGTNAAGHRKSIRLDTGRQCCGDLPCRLSGPTPTRLLSRL